MSIAIVITQDEHGNWFAEPRDLPDYESLRAAVGGWIEAIPTSDEVTIYVDEEGKIKQLPVNPVGQFVWSHFDQYGCIAADDWMAGPCVIFGPADEEGDNTDAPAHVYELLGLPFPSPVL